MDTIDQEDWKVVSDTVHWCRNRLLDQKRKKKPDYEFAVLDVLDKLEFLRGWMELKVNAEN